MTIANGVLANATNFNTAFVSRIAETSTAGGLTIAGTLKRSVADALTAHAGGGQGSALALTKDLNRISTVSTAGDSVKLLAALPGMSILVVNAGANRMDVFPASGEQINSLSTNAALSVLAGQTAFFICRATGFWVEVLATPLTLNAVSGSTGSPNLIAAAAAIPIVAGALHQTVYIAGSGGAVTTGGVHITAGTIDGQKLTLISTHATNTVTITDGDGTGTEGNGDIVHGLRTISQWTWDGTRWCEIGRNGL